MLTALVLICSTALTPDLGTCSRENALNVIRVPTEFNSPVACLMRGQAYIAETEIGQELTADERVKLICSRSQRVGDLASSH